MSLFNLLRKPSSRQRGSILVPAAGALLVGVVLLASADIGFAFYAKRELQKAVDMAALTGVQALQRSGMQCTNTAADAVMLGLVADSVDANLGNVFEVPVVSMTAEPDDDGAQAAFVRVTCGVWDPLAAAYPVAPAALAASDAPWHFSSDLSGHPANAVRVRGQMSVPALFPFVRDKRVWAHAVANQDEPVAAFSVGSGLASLDGGVLNQVLGSLLGSSVSLDVLSYRGLATTSITLLEFLDLLDIDASVGTVDKILDAEILLLDWVDAIVTALDEREGVNIAALNTAVLSGVLQNAVIRLSDVLDLGTNATHGALTAALSLADLLMVGLQAANQENLINLGTGIDLGVLAKVDVKAHIVEPPRIAVGPAGQDQDGRWRTTAHTAQIRVFLDVRLLNAIGGGGDLIPPIGIPGVATVRIGARSGSFIRLPINLEMASGDAYLQELECRYVDGSTAPGVAPADYPVAVVGARAGIINIFLGDMDVDDVVANGATAWDDLPKDKFSLLDLRLRVRLLVITLADVFATLKASAEVGVPDGAVQPYEEVVFTRREVEDAQAAGERVKKTVGTQVGIGEAVRGALFNPGVLQTELDTSKTQLLGLPLGITTSMILDPVINSLGSIVPPVLDLLRPALNPVLSLLDNVVGPLLAALGIQLGYADVFAPALDEGCHHTARLVY